SYGHIRDLPRKNMSIDIESGTFEPTYEVSTDKTKIVNELKRYAKKADTVWLAADEDREGEAIAWHLAEALKLDEKKTKRIVFHEITKPAILNAVKNPRTVDKNLVDAQQARRVLDRLVGYELSPVLWKKVQPGLSAGRVQSVAVRLIVERENDIEAFNANSQFKVTAEFDLGKGAILNADLPKKFKTEKDAMAFLEKCVGGEFSVGDIKIKPGKKSPSAPFTTSTLQQEASRKLGFSVKQTMVVAQKLYEAGKITYMRTDSVNLSDVALAQASEEILKNYGKEYAKTRKYKTKKDSGAQEAHEAIRPTDFATTSDGITDRNQGRLYDLIWKRSISSQMTDAAIERTTAIIDISTTDEKLSAKGEVLKFDGFMKVYLESNDDEEKADPREAKMLPPIEVGQKLDLNKMVGRESFSRPPARFTEASLVKALEEMRIGRPSTYAPTISTVQDRGYVEKKDMQGREREYKIMTLAKDKIKEEAKTEITGTEKSKLFPTEIGIVVTNFLVKHFADVVDYNFTVNVEKEFDEVAEGKTVWNKMIKDFYKGFHQTVEDSGGISREEAGGVRELGTDPKSGKPVFARIGRFGPMIQIGTKDDEEKPKFASIPPNKKLSELTLDDALEMFKFPKNIGKIDGDDVLVSMGRFGPYLKIGALNVSLKKDRKDKETGEIIPGDDPQNISMDRAKELHAEKIEFEKNRNVKIFDDSDIKILRGPYGIYITNGKKNAKLPKDCEEPSKLTLEECEKLIEAAPERGKRRRFVKKKK
ncbi:MAG: type I DNA topoisomerase, partial [Candidatus Peregrinibacteria bacterium]|nr:type I DNA topoisomerase [Candidatus Peregrinibacteria bacterium]